MGMDMVTKGVHNAIEFLSNDSPDMDVIGISGEFFLYREIGNKVLKTSVSGLVELNILKNLTVYVVAGSLGRFKFHASNIVFDEHSENILPSSEGDVGLAASSGPSVLGDKVDEECDAADPPEISAAQNNRKRCRE
ncbi:BnaCnng27810D [Brassica napus]|uniref:BnaCnng27810D protein n=1 Tax=Brassica napus TaxID=3708 RepID=A0A078IXP4_BRANA|nr:BnaCnng27810D [Brassica napus]